MRAELGLFLKNLIHYFLCFVYCGIYWLCLSQSFDFIKIFLNRLIFKMRLKVVNFIGFVWRQSMKRCLLMKLNFYVIHLWRRFAMLCCGLFFEDWITFIALCRHRLVANWFWTGLRLCLSSILMSCWEVTLWIRSYW